MRQVRNAGAARHSPPNALANCGLIANSIPTNDPIFADGISGGGVNNVHQKFDLGIFGAQVER